MERLLYRLTIIFVGIILLSFSSCYDEKEAVELPEGTFVSFELKNITTETQNQQTDPGSTSDYIIHSLRIIAFDKNTGICKSSVRYNSRINEIIHHQIQPGTYDFVFIANEPGYNSIQNLLDELVTRSYTYENFKKNIAFPSASFASDRIIPMKDEIDNIEVFLNGSGVAIDGGTAQSVVPVNLDRIGVRLDIFLKGKEDLTDSFTGISLTGITDKVPLYMSDYEGEAVNRDQLRSFTLADHSQYFSTPGITSEESANGIVWVQNISRIIMPAHEFSDTGNNANAVEFTINLEGKYNPTCKLMITSGNYTLPQNTRLDLTGIIKVPLELNIKASEWDRINENWSHENRILNVSQIEAKITDFNGVRISFWSNMPKVRVLPEVTNTNTSSQAETNEIFNDLAITNDNPNPTRFFYNAATGSGYMDILIDSGRKDASLNQPMNTSVSYKLALSAENEDGTNPLQREITIKVSQYGTRAGLDPWNVGYAGVFFRNDEKGERIISAQHHTGKNWTARVVAGDFLQISSTPSSDPGAGTNNPGDPEKYTVTPNAQKQESGDYIKGKGRIYFRVGSKSKNTGNPPRYGIIEINYFPDNKESSDWNPTQYLYIRQGEDPDYIYRPNEDIIPSGILASKSRGSAARKFSVYNITSPQLKNGQEPVVSKVDINGAVFVKYPTQAGAFFQWGSLDENDIRRAYHPTKTIPSNEWPQNSIAQSSGFWDNDYKAINEVCPSEYSRPSDGYTTQKAFNGNYVHSSTMGESPDPEGDRSAEIANSIFRVSLFLVPEPGNGYRESVWDQWGNFQYYTVPPTYPGTSSSPGGSSSALEGTRGGIYADGFFDRRPIDSSINAVSTQNADIAYGGLLFYNSKTNASLFFPSAGRRLDRNNGPLEYAGISGYYWTSSIGPWYPNAYYPTWVFGLTFYTIGPISQVSGFGHSIRCIKNE